MNLEMDQGAHLWWYPQVYEIDMAGLVDVPMARHTYNQRPFVSEYVFGEHSPTFAHVHGWWGNTMSRFPTYEQWDDYVELPPYTDLPGSRPTPGSGPRRDLFVADSWKGPSRETAFAEGFFLRGFNVPGEIGRPAATGSWRSGSPRACRADEGHDVRVVAFLTDGTEALVSWELPLGYGVFGMQQWRDGDVFVGRGTRCDPGGRASGAVCARVRGVCAGRVRPRGRWWGGRAGRRDRRNRRRPGGRRGR